MIRNAKAWAKARNLYRKNPVHGAEEYRIPTTETFSHSDMERSSTRASCDADVEDPVLL